MHVRKYGLFKKLDAHPQKDVEIQKILPTIFIGNSKKFNNFFDPKG